MQVYLAATPDEAASALQFCRSLAHVAYRIGPDSTLLRQNPLPFRGGLLSISDLQASPITHPDRLCTAIVRECVHRDYAGVVLDFEEPHTKDRTLFTEKLGQALTASRRTLYVPEEYAAASRNANILICTAISGGSLSQRLEEAISCYGGAHRLALDVQRLRMDFTLPSKTGSGTPLNSTEFRKLTEREKPTTFFSPDLCARYFTYVRCGVPHLVLFDDPDTIREKIKQGTNFHIPTAFLMWPEIKDLATKSSNSQ